VQRKIPLNAPWTRQESGKGIDNSPNEQHRETNSAVKMLGFRVDEQP